MYAKCLKRMFDFMISLVLLVILSPFLILLAIMGAIKMKGNPFFVQPRPGKMGKDGKEKVFKLIKFRTMTCEKDKEGKLLSDEKRLTNYGRFLRSTSVDELPELINILMGDMSIVGPRPLLERYLPFYKENEKARHCVRPGLTGLAQVNGRNNLNWDERLALDVKYVDNISFLNDVKIILLTIEKVLARKDIASGTQLLMDDLDVERAWMQQDATSESK